MKILNTLLFGSVAHAVTEDTQNLLLQCSIKPGDVETARMIRQDCEDIRTYFKERGEQIAFIVHKQSDDGYCVDVKCVNDSILRKFKQNKNVSGTKAPATTTTTPATTKATTPTVELQEDSQEHKFFGPKREQVYTGPEPSTDSFVPIANIGGVGSFRGALSGPQAIFAEGRKMYGTTGDTFTTDYSNVCSLQHPDNQNKCCGPDDRSTCCDYDRKVRHVFGTAKMKPNIFGRRIVGGQEAGALKKSMAYITKSNYMHQFCGGVIIHPNWVLTAAHCLQDYCDAAKSQIDILIKVGKTTKDNFQYDFDEESFYASDIRCHSQNCKADGSPRVNDVALVRLEKPIKMKTDIIEVAELPLAYDEPQKSKKCIMLGWGDTKGTGLANVLKEVEIPIVSNEQCNDDRWRSCGIRSCMMCAGGKDQAPCAGDSGGPLFCPWYDSGYGGEERYQLHGIYSYGRCGSDIQKPSVFTRVSHYREWIQSTLEEYGDLISGP